MHATIMWYTVKAKTVVSLHTRVSYYKDIHELVFTMESIRCRLLYSNVGRVGDLMGWVQTKEAFTRSIENIAGP